MLYRFAAIVAAVALVALGPACGDSSTPQGPSDWVGMEAPATTTPEEGIVREVFLVPGFSPPANPVTNEETPAELNFTRVVRYRQQAATPVAASAIVIGYPGFLGGAGSFEFLAHHLVRRGAAAGKAIEVWAIDRRANLLEDTRGVDTAEVAGDPEIAQRYYFGLDTIDGEPFPGFVDPAGISYTSEWGLETHVEDLKNVIALIPEEQRSQRVFLMGHSLGASFAELYAAWRFGDGTRGAEQLAGLILVDGLLEDTPLTDDEYLTDGVGASLFLIPGLEDIRGGGPRYFELPLFGISALARVEVLSLRYLAAPDDIVDDEERDRALRIQLQLGNMEVPAMTNAAALGWAMDDGSNGITLTAVSCGKPDGGSSTQYFNALADADLTHPDDPDATYTWIDAAESDATELTPMHNLAYSFTHGRTNFAEWYFPTRLSLDIFAAGGGAIDEASAAAQNGIRAFDGPLINIPILAISTEFITEDDYEFLPDRVPSTVEVLTASPLTHVDPLSGADKDGNPVPARIETFVLDNAAAGDVVVPVQ